MRYVASTWVRSIDRVVGGLYLALLAGACGQGQPGSVVPLAAEPASADEAVTWFRAQGGAAPVLHRFRWSLQDLTGSVGGRGTARILPGDSLRFDIAGALGSGRGAAFVVGDSAHWAEPEEDVARLVPNYPLLWAMLGVPRLPEPMGSITRFEDGRVVAWRFVDGADTVEFARQTGTSVRLIADVRGAAGRVGRVETEFGPDGAPRRARLIVPATPARLDITYVSTVTTTGFPADTWVRPGQQ